MTSETKRKWATSQGELRLWNKAPPKKPGLTGSDRDSSDEPPKDDCLHWAQGQCENDSCRFKHDASMMW